MHIANLLSIKFVRTHRYAVCKLYELLILSVNVFLLFVHFSQQAVNLDHLKNT